MLGVKAPDPTAVPPLCTYDRSFFFLSVRQGSVSWVQLG